MRSNFAANIMAAGVCLIVAGVSMAAVTGQWRVQLIRGSTTVGQGVGATEAAAWADCEAKIPRNATSPTVYACQTMRYYATVTPDPVAPPPAREARLSWTPPTQNTDGSPVTNLAGYRISYGTSATALTQTIQLPGQNVSHTVSGLAPGTYQFSIRAYTSAGTESDQSNIVSKSIQ